jgi:hypothetical protein
MLLGRGHSGRVGVGVGVGVDGIVEIGVWMDGNLDTKLRFQS